METLEDVVQASQSIENVETTGNLSASVCVDPGDTGWVLLATVLVLGMMPALAFFEAGLLRRKNTLSIITEVFVGLTMMQFMWYVFESGFIGRKKLMIDDD